MDLEMWYDIDYNNMKKAAEKHSDVVTAGEGISANIIPDPLSIDDIDESRPLKEVSYTIDEIMAELDALIGKETAR